MPTVLLLDSQAVLWLLRDSPRLGSSARATIATATVVHYSAATVWELTIKQMLGRLTLPDAFDAALAASGMVELRVSRAHARGLTAFPTLVRHDPFDRLLLAQAEVDGLTLVTADRVLLTVPGAPVTSALV